MSKLLHHLTTRWRAWRASLAAPRHLRVAQAKRRLEHALQAEGLPRAAAVRVVAKVYGGGRA